MCAPELIIALLLGMAVSSHAVAALSMHQVPFTANHEKEIEEWAHTQFGAATFQRLEVKGRQFLAVFRHMGSGAPRIMAHVYISGPGGLQLLAVRFTTAHKLSLTYDEASSSIRVQSPSGSVFLTFPLESLPK